MCRDTDNSPQNVSVSVVIPAPPATDHVPACIESVLQQNHPADEVILITEPGLSIENLPETVREVEVEECDNMAAMAETGMRTAGGEVRVLLMPNCIPEDSRWLEAMLEPFEDEEVGAVVSQCVSHHDRNSNLSARVIDAVESPELTDDDGHGDMHLLTHLADAVRGELVEKLGHLYDDSLETPGEAVDLAIRLRRAGYRIVLSAGSAVQYHDPSAARSLSGVLGKAIEYGRTDAVLGRAYNVDWIGSRLYAAGVASFFLLPVALMNRPIAVILAGLLFVWGWFLPLRLPVLRWETPVSLLNIGVYAAIVLSIRNHWAPSVFPPREWHPAIIRQWCLVVAMSGSYLGLVLYDGLKGTIRELRDLKGLLYSPAVFALSSLWYAIAGGGYILGFFAKNGPARTENDN
ncbi:MAG: glycosyltransferase [Planctomycetota bacterium]